MSEFGVPRTTLPDVILAQSLKETAIAQPTPETPAFTPVEFTAVEEKVLALASLGGTIYQVGRLMKVAPVTVAEHRDSIIAKSGAKNMANAVNINILNGQLPVKVSAEKFSIEVDERLILQRISSGDHNSHIANRLRMPKKEVKEKCRGLFYKMNVTGRTHSVRRSYELGVFKLPG